MIISWQPVSKQFLGQYSVINIMKSSAASWVTWVCQPHNTCLAFIPGPRWSRVQKRDKMWYQGTLMELNIAFII